MEHPTILKIRVTHKQEGYTLKYTENEKMKYILSFIIVFAIVSIFRALNIYKVIESSSGKLLRQETGINVKVFVKGLTLLEKVMAIAIGL